METIQERFDKERDRHDVDIFVIPAGEWKGPLILSRTCEVKGAGATLWTEGTPALIVEADGVTLNGLRVERTECGKTGRMAAAIDCKGHAVQFSDVEVHGTILHAPNCITDWELPGKVDFGAFAAGKFLLLSPCAARGSKHFPSHQRGSVPRHAASCRCQKSHLQDGGNACRNYAIRRRAGNKQRYCTAYHNVRTCRK